MDGMYSRTPHDPVCDSSRRCVAIKHPEDRVPLRLLARTPRCEATVSALSYDRFVTTCKCRAVCFGLKGRRDHYPAIMHSWPSIAFNISGHRALLCRPIRHEDAPNESRYILGTLHSVFYVLLTTEMCIEQSGVPINVAFDRIFPLFLSPPHHPEETRGDVSPASAHSRGRDRAKWMGESGGGTAYGRSIAVEVSRGRSELAHVFCSTGEGGVVYSPCS